MVDAIVQRYSVKPESRHFLQLRSPCIIHFKPHVLDFDCVKIVNLVPVLFHLRSSVFAILQQNGQKENKTHVDPQAEENNHLPKNS